jgi:glycosyltransferase involved in cell wall biosynthesis
MYLYTKISNLRKKFLDFGNCLNIIQFNYMIKIFDCSNSSERPPHRNGGGPLVNDVMRYLRENCSSYNCDFVSSLEDADVVITNDVFPYAVLDSNKPLVKRMDGIFSHSLLMDRNNTLNEAAQQADKVIFITQYSQDSYFNLYGNPLKSYCVVKHWVDPKVFSRTQPALNKKLVLAASATNWDRVEKRYECHIKFASMFRDNIDIILIGKTNPFYHTPPNMVKVGYLEKPEDMAAIMRKADGFLNLTYRDAATKTVPQAISCGLPVLFANSGGVSEMVYDCGYGIPELNDFSISDVVPKLSSTQLENGYDNLMRNWHNLTKNVQDLDPSVKFKEMLDGYFKEIISVV